MLKIAHDHVQNFFLDKLFKPRLHEKHFAAATVAKKNQSRSFSVLTAHAQLTRLTCVSRVVEKIVDFLVILHLSPNLRRHVLRRQTKDQVFSAKRASRLELLYLSPETNSAQEFRFYFIV